MHITGDFSCPNNSPNIPIALNPVWNSCVVNLIPFEPVPDGSSTEIREANARKMTYTKNQALKDIALDSGAHFSEVSSNPSLELVFFWVSLFNLTHVIFVIHTLFLSNLTHY